MSLTSGCVTFVSSPRVEDVSPVETQEETAADARVEAALEAPPEASPEASLDAPRDASGSEVLFDVVSEPQTDAAIDLLTDVAPDVRGEVTPEVSTGRRWTLGSTLPSEPTIADFSLTNDLGGASQCPTGSVLVGLEATSAKVGAPMTSARALCRTLRPDGTLAPVARASGWAGSFTPLQGDWFRQECPPGYVVTELVARGGETPDFLRTTILLTLGLHCVSLSDPSAPPENLPLLGNPLRGAVTRTTTLRCPAGMVYSGIADQHGGAIGRVYGTCVNVNVTPCDTTCPAPAATSCEGATCASDPGWNPEGSTACSWSTPQTAMVTWQQVDLPTWSSGSNLPVFSFPRNAGLPSNPFAELVLSQTGPACDTGDLNSELDGSVWFFCGDRNSARGVLTSADFARGAVLSAQCPPNVALIATLGRNTGIVGGGGCERSILVRRLYLAPPTARCAAVQ